MLKILGFSMIKYYQPYFPLAKKKKKGLPALVATGLPNLTMIEGLCSTDSRCWESGITISSQICPKRVEKHIYGT